MKALTLIQVFALGLTLANVDFLVKIKKASYGKKSGNTVLNMDGEECVSIINEQEEYRRWR